MEIQKDVYLNEMKSMVNDAVEKIRKEKPNFEIFTASIWTDPSASASSINFDSKDNSDENVNESNEWNYQLMVGKIGMNSLGIINNNLIKI